MRRPSSSAGHSSRARPVLAAPLRSLHERKPNRHVGAAAGALAGDRHGAAVGLDQPLDQREADAESPVRAARAFFLLPEHVEHKRQELRCDALARVADADHAAIAVSRERDGDRAAGWREFQRVEQDVPEDLLQAIAVGIHAERARRGR